jgi:hypothetical protein
MANCTLKNHIHHLICRGKTLIQQLELERFTNIYGECKRKSVGSFEQLSAF